MAGRDRRAAPIGSNIGKLDLSSGPATNDILVYNATTGKWVSQSFLDGDYTVTGDWSFTGLFNIGDPGAESGSVTLDGVTYDAQAKINEFGGGNDANLILHRHATSAGIAANLLMSRARGNTSSHTNVQDNDILGRFIYAGWHTSSYYRAAEIDCEVDGTPGAGDMPGALVFKVTPAGSNTPAEVLRLAQDKLATFAGGVTIIGTTTVPDASFTYAKIANASALSVLGRAANSSGVLADIQAGTDNQVLRRSGTAIAFGALNLASSDAVTGDLPFANLAQITGPAVLGVSSAATADNAAISASTNDRVLRRTSDALNFGQLTAGMFPNTVVPDAALSSNVPLLNAVNTFTGTGNRFISTASAVITFAESPDVIVERSIKIIRAGGANMVGYSHGQSGTLAAPAALVSGELLFEFRARGYDGTAFSQDAASLAFAAREAWTGSTHAAGIDVYTTPIGSTTKTLTAAFDTARVTFSVPVRLFGYTVAALPAGTIGDTAYVTDALAPVFGAAVAGGGAVMVPVYYTGAAWFVG